MKTSTTKKTPSAKPDVVRVDTKADGRPKSPIEVVLTDLVRELEVQTGFIENLTERLHAVTDPNASVEAADPRPLVEPTCQLERDLLDVYGRIDSNNHLLRCIAYRLVL